MEQPIAPKPPVPINIPSPLNSIYINGFSAGITSGDVFVVLQRNGAQIGTLNMSYTVAKSLGDALTLLILKLEKKSDRKIMTSKESAEALSKQDEGIKKPS